MSIHNEFGLRWVSPINPIRRNSGLRWRGATHWIITSMAIACGALIFLILLGMISAGDARQPVSGATYQR